MSYRVVNGKICPVEPIENYNSKVNTNKTTQKQNFADILNEKIKNNDTFVFSSHAAERLKSRNISFNENDMKTINEGINKAQEKGCKESVIFYKDTALVTSIKNRTVITVMDKNSSKGNVFTNVDSVVTL
ncbi:TIGR02530 family flagellar biosynthesis protein [Clostridium pasteurianum]|uniref:Flagellar operon protein n=1 Tax=Clostridium pasteurianum BC1 TaxID=86416 RepID=R4K5C1_CLOPA|nr:TIGR02530 family flagellar biosynthesis protein [Clostridium pasteurianum]AGK97768.1 flagellar operon protein [Clostridium pasteurianum BC1]